MHGCLPLARSWGLSLAQDRCRVPNSVWGWGEELGAGGKGLGLWRRAWGCGLAPLGPGQCQHLWLMAGAQLLEAVLLVLGALAHSDVRQQAPCLLLGMAFEGPHVFVPLDSTSPTQSSCSSDIPV